MSNPDGPFMEEPVTCFICGGWLELSDCRFCRECNGGYCDECGDEDDCLKCKFCGERAKDE